MSLLPYILNELNQRSAPVDDSPRRPQLSADDIADVLGDLVPYQVPSRPSLQQLLQLLDGQHRAVVMVPRHLQRQLSTPQRPPARAKKGAENKGAFAVDVDVRHFRPEELSVQVLKDEGFVVVEGSHEERADEDCFVRRKFTRRYKLPDTVDPDTVTSRLSSDGVLQVTAPRRDVPKGNVRHVAILPPESNQPAAVEQHVAVGDATEAKGKEQASDGKTAELEQ